MSASKFEQDDLKAFLPAAIEVEQTPSSRAGRLIIWLIMLLFLVAVCWAWFGKIDIVAVAKGKVIPAESVKQIQSLETARIKAIHVKGGQLAERGQVLIELDAQLAKALERSSLVCAKTFSVWSDYPSLLAHRTFRRTPLNRCQTSE